MDKAFELLIKDHKKVKGILEDLLSTTANAKVKRRDLLSTLKEELQLHEKIEETIVYPVLEEKKALKDLTLEAYQEHHIVDILLKELDSVDVTDEIWKAKATVLQENLLHHISEEEKDLFPHASKILKQNDLDRIGDEIKQMKDSEAN